MGRLTLYLMIATIFGLLYRPLAGFAPLAGECALGLVIFFATAAIYEGLVKPRVHMSRRPRS